MKPNVSKPIKHTNNPSPPNSGRSDFTNSCFRNSLSPSFAFSSTDTVIKIMFMSNDHIQTTEWSYISHDHYQFNVSLLPLTSHQPLTLAHFFKPKPSTILHTPLSFTTTPPTSHHNTTHPSLQHHSPHRQPHPQMRCF